MKVLLLTVQYPPQIGGVPNFYYNFTKYFGAQEISVLTARINSLKETEVEEGIPVYRTRLLNAYKAAYKWSFLLSGPALFLYITWLMVYKKINFIVLGRNNMVLLFICFMVKKLFKKEYLIFEHGDGDSPKMRFKTYAVKKYFYKNAKGFIVNSEFTKNRLINKYFINSDRVFVLYPGVDIRIFAPRDVIETRKNLDIDGKKVILTVGRLDKRKGHDMVLKAMPQIIKEVPNVMYIIVGTGRNEAKIKALVDDLKIEQYVKFIENASMRELVQIYNACDVFVMPNRELEDGDTEGFGMVFIEANACGKPVVGGRCGGAVEAIKENETGLLADPYDIDDISRKIIYLLRNENIARRMGDVGLRRAKAEFDWEVSTKRNIYKFKETFLN